MAVPVIRVLLADDEAPLREALADLIRTEDGLELVAVVADAETAVAAAEADQPDVALLDVKMPGGGPTAAQEIRECSPHTRVIALSAHEDRASVLAMLGAGAIGYLVKGVSPEEIVEAIRRAVRGQASLSIDVAAEVIEELVHDLSERRQVEEVLRRSEEKFRAVVESAADAVVIADADGHIVLVNARTEQLFGYERAELLGQPVERLLPERFHERYVGRRGGYFADPRTQPMRAGLEIAGLRKDGSEFPVDISLSAVDTPQGRLTIAFGRDITERRQTKDVQRKSEEWFAALIESAPDAVVIIGGEGRIVLVNRQTEQLFGFPRAELLGEPIEKLLPERFHERHVGHRGGFADPRARPMGAGLELAGLRKDGSEFLVGISLSAVDTKEGTLVTAFVREITERTAAEELERKLAARRVLFGHIVSAGEEERRRIANDIHDDSIQMITAAGMRLQILRRTLDDPEQLRLLADLESTIQLSIERLRHLLFELRPPALDHDGLVAALRLNLEKSDEDGGARYRLDDRLTTEPVAGTRVTIYRIVQEALANARKHAQASNVTITLEQRQGGYWVHVVDDGIGFTAAESAAVPGHLGVGAMSERAELAHGWLQIESEPGRGTAVEFWIPELI